MVGVLYLLLRLCDNGGSAILAAQIVWQWWEFWSQTTELLQMDVALLQLLLLAMTLEV